MLQRDDQPQVTNRRDFLKQALIAAGSVLVAGATVAVASQDERPRSTFADKNAAYTYGCAARKVAPTRAQLEKLLGPTCAVNAPSAWARADRIECDAGLALLVGLCMAEYDPQHADEFIPTAMAFKLGWEGKML